MPRRGICGNLSKMSRRQFSYPGQAPECLESKFRCPRIVMVLVRRPAHLAPALAISFPSEHPVTAHGENAEIRHKDGTMSERFLSLQAHTIVVEASEDDMDARFRLHLKSDASIGRRRPSPPKGQRPMRGSNARHIRLQRPRTERPKHK